MDDVKTKLIHLESLLKKHWDNLGLQEKKIADYMLLNQDNLIDLSIVDISKATGVSQPTIVRLCKKLGFNGIKDFKIYFNNINTKPISNPCTWEDSDEEVLSKILSNTINTLEVAANMIESSELSSVSDSICKASNILVFGIGGSALVASFLAGELMRLGLRANSYTDMFAIQHFKQLFSSSDLLLFVSRSGENEPLLKIAKTASLDGAKVIAITSNAESQLARLAHKKIIVNEAQYFENDNNSYSRITQLSIASSIYIMCVLRLGEKDLSFKDDYLGITNYK